MGDGLHAGPINRASFNFTGKDSTAGKASDEKYSSEEYFQQEGHEEEEQENGNAYVDRSAQLSATLNSLAMINVAHVVQHKHLEPSDAKETKEKKD